MRHRLHYANDLTAGITRTVQRGIAIYAYANGRRVRSARQLQRIASLGIPPAWTNVWICPNGHGHLQATGRDARRRKQYIYHADWIAERDSNKFSALVTFAHALPRIRRAVRRDLRLPSLCKERVLAAVVQLMDRACIRVGNDRYRRENGSFGLTTLRERHARARGAAVTLDFRGKAGKQHHIEVDDAALARVVRDCLDLPGQILFQYEAEDGVRSICAQDVNAYLRGIAGVAVTSKDFRTWGGTVCAAAHLVRLGPAASKGERARNVRAAIKAAAERLGNTPAVCRRSYIHPKVFASYERGLRPAVALKVTGLREEERTVLQLLRSRKTRVAPQPPRRSARPPVPSQTPVRVGPAVPIAAAVA
jgi:DNA topoisomerase-1